MYSGYDTLSLQILFVYFLALWQCHPYFILFYSTIFYACVYSIYYYVYLYMHYYTIYNEKYF